MFEMLYVIALPLAVLVAVGGIGDIIFHFYG